MELRQLEFFVAVANRLHFGRAAEDCHITQSALSQQIMKLERDLGARLFDRHSRRVRLTVAGSVLLSEANLLLASAQRVAESTRAAAVDETALAAARGDVKGLSVA